MLQRIQTIWLLIAAALAFAGLKFPFYSGTDKTGIPSSLLTGIHPVYLLMITVAVAVLALVTIFLFRNRTLQLRLCIVNIILQAVLIYLYYRESQTFAGGTYALTAIIQPAVLVCLFLAVAGIRRDNRIIADSNRLR
jgi:hypothetical protein